MSDEKRCETFILTEEQELEFIEQLLAVCPDWCNPYLHDRYTRHKNNCPPKIIRACHVTIALSNYGKLSSCIIEWNASPSINPIFYHFADHIPSIMFNYHVPKGYNKHDLMQTIIKQLVYKLIRVEA